MRLPPSLRSRERAEPDLAGDSNILDGITFDAITVAAFTRMDTAHNNLD
jgi:hypothetical protein